MAIKSTFTLDDATVETIRKLATRSGIPQSMVVREAVAHYAARDEKASPAERAKWLQVFDELVTQVSPRPRRARAEEAEAVRRSRRSGWVRGSKP